MQICEQAALQSKQGAILQLLVIMHRDNNPITITIIMSQTAIQFLRPNWSSLPVTAVLRIQLITLWENMKTMIMTELHVSWELLMSARPLHAHRSCADPVQGQCSDLQWRGALCEWSWDKQVRTACLDESTTCASRYHCYPSCKQLNK